MPSDALPSFEQIVIAEIDAAFEPLGPLLRDSQSEEPSGAEARTIFECWGTIVQVQGAILARLALMPWSRRELKSSMSGIVNRAPAWLDAHYRGERAMTLDLFAQGIAQTMATQRAAFEQVLAEQVSEPSSLQELLAKAPVPADPEKMARKELLAAIGRVMDVHTEVLIGIAVDADAKLVRYLETLD